MIDKETLRNVRDLHLRTEICRQIDFEILDIEFAANELAMLVDSLRRDVQ